MEVIGDSEVSYFIEYSSLDNTLQGVVLNEKKVWISNTFCLFN